MAPHGDGCKHSCEAADHQHDNPETGVEYSLYSKIDMLNLECLNEVTEGSGKTVFKPWERRLDFDLVCKQAIMFCTFSILFFFAHRFILVCRIRCRRRASIQYSVYRKRETEGNYCNWWGLRFSSITDAIVSM